MVADDFSVSVVGGVGRVDGADWDRCAGADNPFVSHAFLSALEDSNSAVASTGWRPLHLLARGGDGRVLGALPLYAKSHSYGEYVFDQGWAAAWERAGGRYHPKLLCAVPFSPVPGPRPLVAPDAPPGVALALIKAVERLTADNDLSSAHANFVEPAAAPAFREAGWLERWGVQYHWHNRDYGDFDDFLAALSSRHRKKIKRERREVADSSVTIHRLTGTELTPQVWDAFHALYLTTADRKWGGGYLRRDFFHRLGATMGDKVLLIMAREDGRWIGGALNLIGRDTLYGRNWGGDGGRPFLHFEVCYYQAIEWAIERGFARVEAGAQGEHKIQRGYAPIATLSFHHLPDPGFSGAVSKFLVAERAAIENEIGFATKSGPYRENETK